VFAVQLGMHEGGHGPSATQILILGCHIAEATHALWPEPNPSVVPPERDTQGFTALHAAALSSRPAITMLLLEVATRAAAEHLASCSQDAIDASLLQRMLRARDAFGRTPMHVAAGAANASVRLAAIAAISVLAGIEGPKVA
jgi:ankyrin repeat protein